MIVPESLTPMLLLSIDSTRSPYVPATETIKEIITQRILSTTPSQSESNQAIRAAIMRPPKKPSHDFFGEIRSINLCRPKDTPVRYAPVSFDHVRIKKPIIIPDEKEMLS